MSVNCKNECDFNKLAVNFFLFSELAELMKSQTSFDSDYYTKYCKSVWEQFNFLQTFIVCFFDRIYIANQLSYCYQYNEKMDIQRLNFDIKRVKNEPITDLFKRDFATFLSNINYNLFTNNLRSFVSADDLEILQNLIKATEQRRKYKTEEEKQEQDAYYRAYAD